MPHLDSKDYPQHRIISDIYAGVSFVKVKPDDIGEIIYFDTNEPTAVPLDDKVYLRRKILIVITLLMVLSIIWIINISLFLKIFFSIIALFRGYLFFRSQFYNGMDYFVGVEGCAIYYFEGNRQNCLPIKAHRFDQGYSVVHKESVLYKKYSVEMIFSYKLVGIPDNTGHVSIIDEIDGKYKDKFVGGNTGDINYDFWYKIEEHICTNYLQEAEELLKSERLVPFYELEIRKDGILGVRAYIQLGQEAIFYNGKKYKKNDIKRVYIKRDIIYFEDSYYSCNLLGIKEAGEKISINLDSLTNRKAFLNLLFKLYGIKLDYRYF